MKILELPLKKEWYNMIESGEKREEYREIKPHWSKRFVGVDKPLFSHRYGYQHANAKGGLSIIEISRDIHIGIMPMSIDDVEDMKKSAIKVKFTK